MMEWVGRAGPTSDQPARETPRPACWNSKSVRHQELIPITHNNRSPNLMYY